MAERFLVTGALGCIGAWTLRTLAREGVPAVGFDLGSNDARLRLVLSEKERALVTLERGDVTDLAALEDALDWHEITHVVHLAALQVPFVRADPPLGSRVNVMGTTAVFEAVKRRQERVRGLAYASSAAVYGPEDGPKVDDARAPATLYGVFKLANEATARVYWEQDGVASVGLRPYVVYGAGRDQGLTAAPTLAVQAAVRRERYEIPFSGRCQLHYAADVARAFVAAARSGHAGAAVFNLGGVATDMREVVDAIEQVVPTAAGLIGVGGEPLPFPEELDAGALAEVLGPPGSTSLLAGVAETLELFQRADRIPA